MRQPERVIELQTVEAPPRDLLLSIPRPRARGLDRVVLHTLNTGEWHDYLNAVLADLGKPGPYQRVTLAEKQASRFGITQTWFNSVRDQLIDAGLWFWVDETDHSKGLGMTPSFVLFMLAFTSQASPLPRSPEGEGEPPTSLPARTQEAG